MANHQTIVMLNELYMKQSLCDAKLLVEDKCFKVHKPVLCACSSFFRSLFLDWSPQDDKTFKIPHLTADMMQTFIEFAYTGVVTVTPDNVDDLFIAADRFDVFGITEACCKFMEESLSPLTFLNTLRLTNMYHYPQLRKKLFSYILLNFATVVRSQEFLQLSVEDLTTIIQHDQLNVSQESSAYEAILLWINHLPEERQRYIPHLLSKVRLALIDPQYFHKYVLMNEMIRSSGECNIYLNRTKKLVLERSGLPLSSYSDYLIRPRLPNAVLMAVGGWTINQPTTCIESYNYHTKQWLKVHNGNPSPRAYHGAVFLNGSLFVLGGFNGTEQFCTMQKYDLVNKTWQEVAPMHEKRCYVSVVVLHGCIYALGGFNGFDRMTTAEKYTPETNQWTMIAPMNYPRSDASSTTLNEKIYICGGFNGDECLATAESYDCQTDQWTLISNMSCRRSGVSVATYAGEIYAVGGFSGTERLNTVEAYNPVTDQWRRRPSMINRRSNFGIAVLDEQLYVAGGYNGFITINAAERFSAKTDEWSKICNMAISRSAVHCCVVRDIPNMAEYCTTTEEEGDAPLVE